MKNYIKLFGIIALVAVMGFSIASCKEEPEEPITLFDAAVGEQTIIKVTGIASTYNSKWAIGGLDTNPVAVALGTEITGGTVELKMLNSDNTKAAYADGYYTVFLILYNSQADANNPKSSSNPTGADSIYDKAAISVPITKGTVSVAFSEFKY